VVGEVNSGEPIAEVARRHRVQPRTLTWWRWKLGSEAPPAPPRFLPVVVSRPMPVPSRRVHLSIGDVKIRFAVDTDVAYVAALVTALRA
jgi:hypothetical protein